VASIGSFKVAKKTIADSRKKAEPDTFDFEDQTFTIIDGQPSALPLMELADAVQSNAAENSFPALAAMYQMLQACIVPDDWGRFRRTIMTAHADVDDVWPIVEAVYGVVSGRPTERPSGSPDGPSTTGPTSKDDSHSPTDQPSRFTVDLPADPPPAPNLTLPAPVSEWAPPSVAGRNLAEELTSIDDLLAGRTG
jgi:hypothetical protein